MPGSEHISLRIDPDLKTQVEDILRSLGLTQSEAIKIYYRQILLSKGLPFRIILPPSKEKTIKKKKLDEFANFKSIILGFKYLKNNFPSESSINYSLEILKLLKQKKIIPSKISPSPDGGIMLEFLSNETYYLIEVFNDGDFVFLKREVNGLRKAFDFNFEQLKGKIINNFYD